MAALAAMTVYVLVRIGWRNALPLALVLAPVLLTVLAGRQTQLNLSDPEDSFQGRLELWDHSLDAFRSAPFFGVGAGRIVDAIGQVCHNSYLHAFAEMGMLGGTAFLGAFILVIQGLRRTTPRDGEMARLRPFVLAMTVGYAAGLLTLSRCYNVPTLLVLAMGAAFVSVASRGTAGSLTVLTARRVRRLVIAGPVFLIATHIVVRVMLVVSGGSSS